MDNAQYENTTEMVDRLMTSRKLTQRQAICMGTFVRLVQAYEAAHLRSRRPADSPRRSA